MNRTQKKCFIASAGLHLVLLLVLLIGPAFLSSNPKEDNLQVLDIVSPDLIATDANANGGGGPRMRPPSPTPEVPQPQPQQQVAVAQTPKPQPVRTQEPDPPKIIKPSQDSIAPVKEPKHKIVVNTEEVVRNQKNVSDAKAAAARAAQAEQQRLAAAFNRATRDLNHGFSGGTDVKFNDGFGGSGPAYANWLQIVKSIYFNDWSGRVPQDATDDTAIATATVTISRDGTVITAHIIQSSGNPAVDRSIQSTLDNVRYTKAFPESAKEDQRELEIRFNVKAVKQLLG